MEELLAQILFAIAETLLYALLEIADAVLLDLVSRGAADAFKSDIPHHPVLTFISSALLGAVAGSISLIIWPHPLVRPSKIHGISIIISPIITATVMYFVGHFQRKSGRRVVQIERFPYAFAFAFGVALVRLIYAS